MTVAQRTVKNFQIRGALALLPSTVDVLQGHLLYVCHCLAV